MRNQSSTFGRNQYPEESGNFQASGSRGSSSASFIDQQKVSMAFDRKHDSLSFSFIQIATKLAHAISVLRIRNYQPRNRGEVEDRQNRCLGKQFMVDRGWNQDFVIKLF